jgi:NAD(P)-dependent dehydrogenase (short-subunit alcohol dehydrogenase family)
MSVTLRAPLKRRNIMSRADHYFFGKKAAISGAGDGIGRALAERLNRAGCHVWLCDVNEAKLAETVNLLDRERAGVITRVVDCGHRDELFAWAQSVAEDTPEVDALFNNAGVGYGARFEDSTEDNFKWLIDINFLGSRARHAGIPATATSITARASGQYLLDFRHGRHSYPKRLQRR